MPGEFDSRRYLPGELKDVLGVQGREGYARSTVSQVVYLPVMCNVPALMTVRICFM